MASPAPIHRYNSRDSKRKRVLSNASSSLGFNDVEMFETAPPGFVSSKPRASEKKKVATHEIIDLDLGEGSGDESLNYVESGAFAKGKKHLPGDSSATGSAILGSTSDTVPSHNLVGGDDYGLYQFFNPNEWLDNYQEDIAIDDNNDDYGQLMSKFDNFDVPSGVEAEFPWLLNPQGNHTKEVASTSSNQSLKMQLNKAFPLELPTWMTGIKNSKQKSRHGASSGGLKMAPKKMNPPPEASVLNWGLEDYLKPSWNPSEGMAGDTVQSLFHYPVNAVDDTPSIENPPSTITENIMAGGIGVFKKFDSVEDCSDHHFFKNQSCTKQAPKKWAKRIQEEWKILENDLPDTIFVRVYESRMDLLRAVIVGAEGTPYHDGLFFFDVFFPISYPNSPPLVHYHSGGLRINPNLYNCGKVCLSLLHTWSGTQKEKWIPGVSTMLQVLVSIQALILNAKPYFNEPGYASTQGSPIGDQRSFQYNEKTFLLSLRTMAYSMKNPPKHFKELVIGYFCERAQHILISCKAYLEGAQVGSLVEGGVQDVDEGDKSCSKEFKTLLSKILGNVIHSFKQIGAKDCDPFLELAAKQE